jgi:uncharacterized membrane protein YhaH (DUF805 family)
MSPMDWATRPLKRYSDFSSRAPRAEFWWFYLLLLVLCIVGMFVDSIIGSKLLGPYGIVTSIIFLVLLVPYIGVAVRRLHDTNRSGWWMLGPIVPYAIGIAMMGPVLSDPAALTDPAATGGTGMAMIFLGIGLILGLVVLVFFLMAGNRGPNKYGDDPYGSGAATAAA